MKGKDGYQGFQQIAGRNPSYNIAATERYVVAAGGKKMEIRMPECAQQDRNTISG